MLYCTWLIMCFSVSCGRANWVWVVSLMFMVGKSAGGRVCRLKRDLPALSVSLCSSKSSCTVAFSGSARRMSCSFLALVVSWKSPCPLSAPWVWIWISRSVARMCTLPPLLSSNTLAKMGSVCLRSTMPVAVCRGLSSASRSVCRINMMGFLCVWDVEKGCGFAASA